MTLKKWCYFLKLTNFSKRSKTMLTRTAPFLWSISMWKRLNLNFLDKCGWYIPFSTYFMYFYVFFSLFLIYFSCSCSCLVLVLLMLLKTFFVCPPACRRRLFFLEKRHFLKKWYFFKCEKTIFWQKMIKNTTFEFLAHHHELNQKKLILLKLFMLKIDSTMLKLWSIPVKSCIFYIFLTFVESWL